MNQFLQLDGFRGILRLFPLPNFVMLPHVVKAFHIFEPRYRELVEHTLAGDKYVTLVMPKAGWESDYEGSFPLHEYGCLTQIMNHEQLPDGRFNIVVRGICRVKLDQELLSSSRYRQAKGTLLPDPAITYDGTMRQELLDAVYHWVPDDPTAKDQFETLLSSINTGGMVADIISFAIPLPPETKQQLLETLDVTHRLKTLVAAIHQLSPRQTEQNQRPSAQSPPDFSNN